MHIIPISQKQKDKINNLYHNGRITAEEISKEMCIRLETVHKYIEVR